MSNVKVQKSLTCVDKYENHSHENNPVPAVSVMEV